MKDLFLRTNAPFDHVPRVLDILRKMDIPLSLLAVEAAIGVGFLVRLSCQPQTSSAAHTFVERIGQIAGLYCSEENLPQSCGDFRDERRHLQRGGKR